MVVVVAAAVVAAEAAGKILFPFTDGAVVDSTAPLLRLQGLPSRFAGHRVSTGGGSRDDVNPDLWRIIGADHAAIADVPGRGSAIPGHFQQLSS